MMRRPLSTFSAGLVLGFFLAGVAGLPVLFADSRVFADAKPDDAGKSRSITIIPSSPKPSTAAADSDDFIEGNYWALIIGLNKYPSMEKDKQLEAARKDAEAVAKLLVERYGFSRERMMELYDDDGTRRGVIRALNSFKRRLSDKDSLFIYYAGHGDYETSGKDKEKDQGMGYWIPSDAELDDPSTYIFNSQVRDYLANIPARHIYAVVDSCFSASLMGRTRAIGLSKSAIKELYQEKSRWILASGGFYPVPDIADKSKKGHSTFAWHFMKILRDNTGPYLLAKDIIEPLAVKVSNDVQGQLPRSTPVIAAGDEGGQFVFRLRKEFQKGAASPEDVARIEAERAKVAAAQAELSGLEEQLKKAEEALKKQQEEMAARKQAMLARLKQAQEQAAREAAAEEQRLAVELKAAEEKAKREAEARQAYLNAQAERAKKAEEERLAAAAQFEQQRKALEEKAREAQAKRQEKERRKLEAEIKAAQQREQKRLAELKRKQDEQERKAAKELRLAEEKRQAEEKRLAAQKAKAEAERLATLKRQEEETARRTEEERSATLAAAEEQTRKLLEAKKKAEEEQKVLLARQQAVEEEARRGATGKPGTEGAQQPAPIVEATLRPYLAPKAKDSSPVVLIPEGEFIMGSKPGDGQPDESPQRKIYLNAYTIDQYEVTVAQYAEYLKKSKAEPPDFWERVNVKEEGNRPVIGVDWLEASEYCEFYGKRLPTEAQWEKAARGVDGRKYPWGDQEPGPLLANYASGVSFSYGKSLYPVGNYESGKSPYSVYDMVGNVWEWTLDWYHKDYYQAAPLKNPAGPDSGDYKVIRGGSWAKRPAVARVAGRMHLLPSQRSNSLGFRCVAETR